MSHRVALIALPVLVLWGCGSTEETTEQIPPKPQPEVVVKPPAQEKPVFETRTDTVSKTSTPEPAGRRKLTPFTCPNCGGALWEIEAGGLDQYECHVGHRFGSEALRTLGDDRTENLLWSAVRAMKEAAALRRRMAARASNRGMATMARRWQDEARTSQARANQIRALIEAMDGGSEEYAIAANGRRRRAGARQAVRRETEGRGRKKPR